MFDEDKKYTAEELEDILLKWIDRNGGIESDADVQDFIESLNN